MDLTKEIAQKVVTTVDAGLCSGVGKPIPGQMCIEAAVCFAMGLPHGDEPSCVGFAVRSFEIQLNDCDWSSEKARAKGLRKIAVAQLGSDTIDQTHFARLLWAKTIERIVPRALRSAADMEGNAAHADKLLAAAVNCETTASAAASAAASDAATAASYAAIDARAETAARAAGDAAGDAATAARAASATASDAAGSASYAARAASYAASAAETAAGAASDAGDAEKDKVLTLIADIAVEVLVELKSPGCQWLDLCEIA